MNLTKRLCSKDYEELTSNITVSLYWAITWTLKRENDFGSAT